MIEPELIEMQEFGQLLPTARKRPGGGSLLVLGSTNLGEVCSSVYDKVSVR